MDTGFWDDRRSMYLLSAGIWGMCTLIALLAGFGNSLATSALMLMMLAKALEQGRLARPTTIALKVVQGLSAVTALGVFVHALLA